MLPRLWPRLLRRVKQRCRTRTAHVGAAIERLEQLLMLTNWSGDIPDGTVWSNAEVQRIVGNVRVPAGATLTVQPGTVVKFNEFADFAIAVEGTLIGDGTAGLPIVFTSFADDTGLDGMLGTVDDQDSNGNGPSNGVASSWQRIEFRASSTDSRLDHVDIRFGGENVSAQVLVDGELTLTNSVVRDSATGGMRIVSANPTITGTTFRNNIGAMLGMDLVSNPAISGVTFASNGINGLNVDGGTLTQDITWDDPDIVYRLTSDVVVPSGRTLSIGAGQIVKSASFNEPGVIVSGTLLAAGMTGGHIVFTSDNDDSVGGDTLNNGPTGVFGGESGGLRFNPGSNGTLDFVEVRYAGDPFNSNNASSAVFINDAQVAFQNGVVRDSGYYGVRIQNSDPIITGTTFQNNLVGALSMDLSSNPSISSPRFTNNGINGLILDGGTLPANATWDDPDVVYHLPGNSRTNNFTGNVTVPQGTTLTIAPGQVIKAGSRSSAEIFVDGTLIADGTRDAPIIFTSVLDDSVGGDTTSNGVSSGQFFDWQALRFRATSTGNVLDHIEVRFAGANVPAAVTAQGATLTMTNSVVRGSANHAVAARSSASVVLENNILVNSAPDRGAGISSETGSIVTAVNNTIDGNFRGVSVLTSATANLRNNLITNSNSPITNSTSAGIFAENLATVIAVFNDVFNPGRPNYSGLTDLTGQSGNISLDPRYFNRANLQYQLQAGSPALDAGTSDFTPTTDFVGNPRFDDPNVINRGGGAMPFFDLGAFERQEVSSSDVDLATLRVSGPITGMPSQLVSVNWTVQNLGTGTAIGPWSDAVYLSNDPVWSIDDRFLGRLQHNGDSSPGLSYDATTNVTLTGLLPGRNFFIVRANDLNQVFEGLAEGNNAAASASSIDFALPTLAAGVPFADQFTMAGQSRFYQITVPPGQSLNLVLDSAGASGATELYIRQGGTPSRSQFDFSSVAVRPDQSLLVPTTGPGTYYILAFANIGAAANSAFTLTASIAGFEVRGVTPNSGANSGRVTVAVQGTRMTRDTQVSLVAPDSSTIPAVTTQFHDASQIYATFDLTGQAPGSFGVQIKDDAVTDTASGIFTVTLGNPGHLTTNIIAPDRIRRGVAASITIEYANDGGADLTAPLLTIAAENADLRFPDQPTFVGPALEFLGINKSGPAGVLPPGARGSVQVVFLPRTNENVNFVLGGSIPQTPLDWNVTKEFLRPPEVPTDAWEAIYANFLTSVGGTVGQYEAALARDATYLSTLGEYVSDVTRLLAFEFTLAGNFGAITERYTLGAFGRGFPDPTDTLVTASADNNVTIRRGGKQRVFVPVPGGFQGAPGDFATLTFVDGAFRLRESNGSIIRFLPNGKPNFIEDTNGNRTTAVYAGDRLTGYADSFGDQVTYTYNAQGRIQQVTDAVGRVTAFAYDAAGEHLRSVSDPLGTTAFTYITGQGAAREHAVASVTFPGNSHQFFEYDAQGRLTRTFLDGGAQEVRYAYEALAGVTSIDLSGDRTTLLVNDLGQPGLAQDPTGRITRFFYDANQQLVRVEGPDGSRGEVGYDEQGNPTRSLDPRGQRLDVGYELGLNRLLSLRDSRGQMTSFSNDAHGNLLAITHADGSAQRFAYDSAGNVVESVNRRGQSSRFTYDAENLPVREDFADGSRVDYTYDSHRNLISASEAAAITSFQYDAADRPTRVTYPNGRSLQFIYDAAGRRTRTVDQSGFTVNYAYDALGRLSELTDGAGGRIVLYTYEAEGRLAQEDRGNGAFTVYTYFADSRVQSIVHRAPNNTVLSRFDYTYDTLGLIASMTTLDGMTTYGYDAVGQLTRVNLPGGRTITYQYDAAGNRVSVTDNGATTSYATNSLNQYTAVSTTTFAYDADGNLISKTEAGGTTNYNYDSLGRLDSVISPTDTFTYEYDVLGNRIASTRNGQRTEYLIDPVGQGDVLGEYDSSGQLIAHYVHGNGLVSRIDAANAEGYFTFDVTGNASQLTGPAGAVLNSYQYLPFGEPLSAAGTTPNPFTYAGQFGVMRDGSGLYFMRNRYYDPALGRFASPDPIGFVGADANLYRYAGNQPTGLADPDGLANTNVNIRPPVPAGTTQAIPRPLSPTLSGGATAGGLFTGVLVIAELAYEDYRLQSGLNYVGHTPNYTIPEGSLTVNYVDPRTGVREKFFVPSRTETIVKSASATVASGVVFILGGAAVVILAPAGGLLAAFGTGIALTGGIIASAGSGYLAGIGIRVFRAPESLKLGDRAKFLREFSDKFCGGLNLQNPNQLNECVRRLKNAGIILVAPNDPNDIGGPVGFGPQHFITGEDTLPYTILFENKPDALAPAVKVAITQQLDADLDLATFELGSFGFGDRMFDVPAGRRFYSTRLDLTETIGEYVDVTAGIDLATGIATWTFRSIDPATGEQATDVDAGFLPPDVNPPEGEGFVNYTIRALPTLATGTTMNAQASIRFDVEDVIDTPLYVNTIDVGDPTSSVAPLPAQVASTNFTVSWSSSDEAGGSDVASVDVFVSDNGGPFQLFLDDTIPSGQAVFPGQELHSYAFFSVATDNVGHREAASATPDATTAVVGTPDLVATRFDALSDHVVNGQTLVRLVIENQGAGPAGPFEVQVILSDDDVVGNADDVVVTTITYAAGLDAGGLIDQTVDLQLVKSVLLNRALRDDAPGQGVGFRSTSVEFLALVIDPGNQIAEGNAGNTAETNNLDQGQGVDKDDVTYFPWDTNGSGAVTPVDAGFVINRLGLFVPPADPRADLNGNGAIQPTDAGAVINRLGYLRNDSVIEVVPQFAATNQTSATDGKNTLDGGLGHDPLNGDTGNDTLDGGTGNDGNDTVLGGTGADSVLGGSGIDLLIGEEANDTLADQAGIDSLWGGADSNTFVDVANGTPSTDDDDIVGVFMFDMNSVLGGLP